MAFYKGGRGTIEVGVVLSSGGGGGGSGSLGFYDVLNISSN